MSSALGYYRTTAASMEGERMAQASYRTTLASAESIRMAHAAIRTGYPHETCEKITTWLKECFCCCLSAATPQQPVSLNPSAEQTTAANPNVGIAIATVLAQR